MRSLCIIAKASTSRSPCGASGAEISREPEVGHTMTARRLGSDDNNSGTSSPECAGRAAGSDQGNAGQTKPRSPNLLFLTSMSVPVPLCQ